MKNILIILFFFSQIAFGQRQIQHEPERIFNILNNGKSNAGYAKKQKLNKVLFYRDSVLSSSIEFDKNGNFITTIGMENDVVRKATYKWDEQNRMVETKYFSKDDSFKYGYYYRYENCAQLTYKIEDSLLFRKETFLKGENISTYSEYDTNGIIITKSIYVKDKEMRWLLETRFQYDRIYVQYIYEYLDNKKYVTKIQYDNKGTKRSEKRYLDQIKINNSVEHYTSDEERLFRVDSFDTNGNLLSMTLLDKDGNKTNTESSKYNAAGQLIKLTKINLGRNQKAVYNYKYDSLDRLELVTKIFNGESELFKYLYEVY